MTEASPERLTSMSVQDRAHQAFASEAPLTLHLSMIADGIPQYGSPGRDEALDRFWKLEPLLAGAVYSMCAKMAALDFRLRGPRRLVRKYRRLLLSADLGSGNGWINFIFKLTRDLLTQDNGAFIEFLRPPGALPTTQVQGIAHIDSQKCERTGNPLKPVNYLKSKDDPIPLEWYQVLALSDFPSPREDDFNRGFCAVSRVLRAAQVMRDIGIYKRQKLAGKRTPGIMIFQGIPHTRMQEAVLTALEAQQDEGLSHFTLPLLVGSMDPGVPVDAKLIELAGLPDGFDEDVSMKWYIATLALDFGTDYTEFAPLPGGNLGSATQATEMAARARGKGPGATLQQLEFAMNYWVLPESMEFQFASTDPIAERERIEQRRQRAEERSTRISSGEITVEQALELAVDEGDAPSSFLDPTVDETEGKIDTIVKSLGDLQEAFETVEKALHA